MTGGTFNPWTSGRKLKVAAAVIAAAGASAGSYYGWGHGSPSARDVTAPTCTVTAPTNGATVSGTVTVSATCSDSVGVAGVQFKLNGANLAAEDTSAPYSISWDTTISGAGSYTIEAVGRDASGNLGTSASISATVNPAGTPEVANIFVNTTAGASPSRCSTPCTYDSTHAYGSFDAAYQAASSGDTIQVRNGSYGTQTIFPKAAITSAVTFYPQDAASVTFTNVVQIKASHVEFDDFVLPAFTSQSGHPFALKVEVPNSATKGFNCISDITLRNVSGGAFSINNGVSDLNIIGGVWGQDGWRLGDTPDGTTSWNAPTISASSSLHCPDSSTVAAPANDIDIDGVKFGDRLTACQDNVTYGANPQSLCAEPTHPDCLHIYGPTVGVHVHESWFDHCMGFYMNLNVENASAVNGNTTIKNMLFENNIFGDDNAGGYDSWGQIAHAGTGPLYGVCDNVVFRNNTWGHNQTPNTIFAIDCSLAPGATVGVAFYNNIFTNWNGACPSNTTFDYNLFVTGATCGTHTSTGSAAFVQATDDAHAAPYAFAAVPWTSDFTPGVGSAAIDAGSCDATTAATTDYNGDARPTGTCDVGAINH